MSQNTVAVVAGLAISAGPMAQVFDEMGLVVALCGALGGILKGLFGMKAPFLAAFGKLAVFAFTGAIAAFGVAGLLPYIIQAMIGIDVAALETSARLYAGGAFLVGFLQERALERFAAGAKDAK